MPRPAKRKAGETAAIQPITNFTRVSKAYNPQQLLKKTVTTIEPAANKKRKASTIKDDANHIITCRTVSFAPSSDDEHELTTSKRACRRQQEPHISLIKSNATAVPTATVKTSAAKGNWIAKTLPSRSETAHKPSESTVVAKSRSSAKNTNQRKIDTIFKKATKKDNGFPAHLAELVDLHRAFLKTVMLQIAHNGSNVPIDIRSISPHISRTWGKRQVTLEDIQRCVAIQSSTEHDILSPFTVSDYGRGKVCIELGSQYDGTSINEDRLCKQFENNLRHICSKRLTDKMTDVDINLESLSLGDLPKAAITNMDLGLKVNPVLVKGQRALTELKGGIIAKQQEQEAKKAIVANGTMLNPDGTKMNLLDRLRYKQLARENGPLPPSGPELERRAALNRVMDVSATISMLSLQNPVSLPRQAFTMPAILQSLRDSLRVPVSTDEGTKCIRLIASDVAPEWLRIVTIGGRENVVVQRNGQPIDRVLQERVQKLLA